MVAETKVVSTETKIILEDPDKKGVQKGGILTTATVKK